MSTKLIALDMDGTLLKDEDCVTTYTKEVIQEALKDVHIVLCTGRPLSYCYSYIIVNNGAQTWNVNKELIDQYTMDTHIIESIWRYGRTNNLYMMLASTEKLFINKLGLNNFNDY